MSGACQPGALPVKLGGLSIPESLFLIAGNGHYPGLVIAAARAAGVRTIAIAAFENETLDSTLSLIHI